MDADAPAPGPEKPTRRILAAVREYGPGGTTVEAAGLALVLGTTSRSATLRWRSRLSSSR